MLSELGYYACMHFDSAYSKSTVTLTPHILSLVLIWWVNETRHNAEIIMVHMYLKMSLHTLPSSLTLCLLLSCSVSPFSPSFMSVVSTAEAVSTTTHTPTIAASFPLTWRISFYTPAHTRHPPVCVPVHLCVCCATFSCKKVVLPPLPPCSHWERKIWVWLLAWPLFYWMCASHELDKCPAAWEASCSSAVLYRFITHPVSFLKSFSFYSSLWLMRGTVRTSLCISL